MSVDSSAPTILHRVRVPSTPSTLFSCIVCVLYLSLEKNENKQKEAGFSPFLKKLWAMIVAQLAEIRGSNPDIGNFIYSQLH